MTKKFILLTMLTLLTVTFVPAQKIIFEGGYFNPERYWDSTNKTYYDGIRIGAIVENKLKNNFGYQYGLMYYNAYSHNVQHYSMVGDSVIFNRWTHGIEIPLRVVYNQKLFKDVTIFGFAGPNIQIGLAHKLWMKASLSDELQALTGIVPTDDVQDMYTNELNRINIQLGAGGGVQWKKYMLKSGYDWGINNLDKTGVHLVTQGNWYVSFGYQFK